MFDECESLHSVNIVLEDVTEIGDHAFEGWNYLTSITIPEGVTAIGDGAFAWCRSLTVINVPGRLRWIGKGVFRGCESLREASLTLGCMPEQGYQMFDECESLHSVNIVLEDVTEIGDHVFEGWDYLTSITIPEGVTAIGCGAFAGCSSLAVINIPDTVMTIDAYAFSCCTSLPTIHIPANVMSIGVDVFQDCHSLKTIKVEEANSHYSSIDGMLFDKDGRNLIRCPEAQNGVVVIPDNVFIIEDNAFNSCKEISSITLPKSIANVGWCAFEGCSSLSELVFNGACPSFDNSSYPKPIFFFVPREMGWEDFYEQGVTIIYNDNIPIPEKLEISGNSSLSHGANSTYDATLYCSDGAIAKANIVWSLSYCAYASLNGNSVTNLNNTFTPKTVILSAQTTYHGEKIISTKEIILEPSPPKNISFTLSLEQGWNLCSLPFLPDDDSIAILKNTGICWGWNNGQFKPLETILAGQGFWIYAPSQSELLLKGEEADPVPLCKGWNLVGSVSNDYLTCVNIAWQLDDNQMKCISIEKNGNCFQLGKGYWIFVK